MQRRISALVRCTCAYTAKCLLSRNGKSAEADICVASVDHPQLTLRCYRSRGCVVALKRFPK